jgi:hypothetical protein
MKQVEKDDFDETVMFKGSPRSVISRNPLKDYFRVPGLHITLPTRGKFLPEEYYDETMAGEVPVYPMKAADELMLKSPDALMSGYALEQLVQSCVPAIKEPRLVSTPDLDVILLAIRAATYGEIMEIEVVCPECGHNNAFDCHLPTLMSRMTFVPEVIELRLNSSLVVHLRPYSMGSSVRTALGTFNEARKLQQFDENSEERTKVLNESFKKLSEINLEGIADCIIDVVSPNGIVTDRGFIFEFVCQTDQKTIKKIEKKLIEINQMGIDKKLDATCIKCSHEWSPEIEFDPSSFFEQSS